MIKTNYELYNTEETLKIKHNNNNYEIDVVLLYDVGDERDGNCIDYRDFVIKNVRKDGKIVKHIPQWIEKEISLMI